MFNVHMHHVLGFSNIPYKLIENHKYNDCIEFSLLCLISRAFNMQQLFGKIMIILKNMLFCVQLAVQVVRTHTSMLTGFF